MVDFLADIGVSNTKRFYQRCMYLKGEIEDIRKDAMELLWAHFILNSLSQPNTTLHCCIL
jgi:hypothetical protein